ncbi:DUF4383 domain-containing protein [Skermanella sp. TT6]|uniref:DUF4383 domain-containing protein n=1 Tax=Skermanella cutis TaxID=2775420 RepID=A0ABX7BER4_9PROT|nr:DUF4383 domain-containing protein [Skermanella sp. TT6]QQP92085.1 DUF4383 domain-containing protein [Skermanella sp. TT6]
MSTRYFSLVLGIVFLLIGVAGFVPGLMHMPEHTADVEVTENFGRLFGLFPVNILHNVVHIAFGIWGIAAYRSYAGARSYSRAVAVIYAVLAVMGLIPGLNTTFGLIPLYGHDVWLHAVIAIAAAYFGFAAKDTEVGHNTTTTTTHRI